jgi:GNAT superfamily N-acetyltransferase
VKFPAPDGYDIDDDPARVVVDVVWGYLSTQAYWARWRDRAAVEAQLTSAWRVVAAYHSPSGDLVGFCRALSDGVALAYLADVFVLPAHTGRGLGTALVAAMVDGPGVPEMRWMLHTRDAHGLYERFGFSPEAPPTYMERSRPGGV